MIKVENFSYKTENKILFESTTFEFEQGINLIQGVNGSGKTTFFNCLLKKISNYAGDISLEKVSIKKISKQNLKKQIAYIRQEGAVFEKLTVKENFILLLNKEEMLDAQILFEQYVNQDINKLVKQLSGGQKTFLNIILGIVQKRKVYIIDEPFNNLSSSKRKDVLKLIMQLKGIVLVVDHTNLFLEQKNVKKIEIKKRIFHAK